MAPTRVLRKFYDRGQHHFAGKETVREDRLQQERELVTALVPHNYELFAQFFVVQLMQVGLCPVAEQDAELLAATLSLGKDPEKLQKLHRRFSTPKCNPAQGDPKQCPWWPPYKALRRNQTNRGRNRATRKN